MNYFLQTIDIHKKPHAGYKALKDTYTILNKIGYKPLQWRRHWLFHIIKLLAEKIFYRKVRKLLTPNDTILIQWPDHSIKYQKYLYDVLVGHCHVQILVHDIDMLRDLKLRKMEQEFFLIAETLIVHTNAMKMFVCRNYGIKSKNVKILTTFDYLTDNTYMKTRRMSKTIIYAGNLKKSQFLQYVDSITLGDCVLNCYGKGDGNLGDSCRYKGVFSPDHISDIEGSWGLVWDGETTDTCSGKWGAYLKYNSPHKVSLYLAAGIPVIIWRESALADYIQSKFLGIVVEKLSEIPNRLNSISAEEYSNIVANVQKEGSTLRNGGHLSSILLQVLN